MLLYNKYNSHAEHTEASKQIKTNQNKSNQVNCFNTKEGIFDQSQESQESQHIIEQEPDQTKPDHVISQLTTPFIELNCIELNKQQSIIQKY